MSERGKPMAMLVHCIIKQKFDAIEQIEVRD